MLYRKSIEDLLKDILKELRQIRNLTEAKMEDDGGLPEELDDEDEDDFE